LVQQEVKILSDVDECHDHDHDIIGFRYPMMIDATMAWLPWAW